MRILVLGLGNVLVGDDAFGPHVLAELVARYHLPEVVEVLDAGTPGLDLTPHIAGADALLVVDTVRASGAPGEQRIYRRDAILKHPPPARVSPHDPGLKDTLLTLELHGTAPADVVLIGAIPGDTSTGVRLSETIRGAIEPALAAVCEELERLGAPAVAKAEPEPVDLWWTRPGAHA